MADNRVLVSFVIPHKGREDLLCRTLESIAGQDFDLAGVEVILVTQNASLAPATIPADGRLRVELVHRPEIETISRLRNIGVQHAGGRYLAFLDADVELAPNWVSAMIDELESCPGRVLVSAVQDCAHDAPPLERIRTALSNAATDANVRFLPGRNLLLRRETFDAVGGFPEHLITCEDYYFTDRVHALGQLFYSSRSRYVHLGEDKVYGEMFRKEIWRGQSNLQSIAGRRIPLSELPSFLVPLWILLFSLVVLAGLLTARPFVFLGALVLMLLPVALYTLRLSRIAHGRVGLRWIVKFYLIYFPARVIGTLTGLFKSVRI